MNTIPVLSKIIIFSCSCQIREHICSLQRNRTLTLNPWNSVSANPFAFTKYLTDSLVRAKNFLHNSALSAVALAPKPLKCAHHMWAGTTMGKEQHQQLMGFFPQQQLKKELWDYVRTQTTQVSKCSSVQTHVKANSLPLKKIEKVHFTPL